MIQYGLPNHSLSGRVGGPRPVPTSSVDPSEQNEQSDCPDWDERDWEYYNYDLLYTMVYSMIVYTMVYSTMVYTMVYYIHGIYHGI